VIELCPATRDRLKASQPACASRVNAVWRRMKGWNHTSFRVRRFAALWFASRIAFACWSFAVSLARRRGESLDGALGDVNNRQASDPGQCVNGNSYVSRLLYCAGNTSADWSNERLTVLEDLANLTSYGAGLPSSRRRHPLRFARRCGPSTSLAVSLPTHASPRSQVSHSIALCLSSL
jgi:hypothetical protein